MQKEMNRQKGYSGYRIKRMIKEFKRYIRHRSKDKNKRRRRERRVYQEGRKDNDTQEQNNKKGNREGATK